MDFLSSRNLKTQITKQTRTTSKTGRESILAICFCLLRPLQCESKALLNKVQNIAYKIKFANDQRQI